MPEKEWVMLDTPMGVIHGEVVERTKNSITVQFRFVDIKEGEVPHPLMRG